MANSNSKKNTETPKVEETKTKRNYVRKKPTTTVFVEFADKQLSQDDLIAEAKSVMTSLGEDAEGVKKFIFYIQPNNKAIFFTADGLGSEKYYISIG